MAVKKEAAKAPEKKVKEAVKPAVKPDLREFLGEIEQAAYSIYLERRKNSEPGDEMSDWLKAEKQIKMKYRI